MPSDNCAHCTAQIHDEGDGVWRDNSGGDVCGWDGGNEPHEPALTLADFYFTVTDPDSETTYTPWTDGHAVGFKCERNGEVEYVYLNPSGGSDDGVPTIFAYQGRTGEAGQDGNACDHHYVVFSSDPIEE